VYQPGFFQLWQAEYDRREREAQCVACFWL